MIKEKEQSILDVFGTVVKPYEQGKIFGRENELNEVYKVLGRKRKNNVMLTGEAGVGKTSVVYLLAQAIHERNCPVFFNNKVIYSLDAGRITAGTKYRGQMEERLIAILEECVLRKNIILFIDEIHMINGSGGENASSNISNLLKPYITKGDFNVIGATTIEEYKKNFEKDEAIKRRFYNLTINEPSISDTNDIIENIIHNLNNFLKLG